jgi:hypothetical protein
MHDDRPDELRELPLPTHAPSEARSREILAAALSVYERKASGRGNFASRAVVHALLAGATLSYLTWAVLAASAVYP